MTIIFFFFLFSAKKILMMHFSATRMPVQWQNHELDVFRGLSVFFHICLKFFHQMLNINRSQQYVLFCCVEFWICFSLDINYVFRITLLWTSVWIWSCLSFSRHEDLIRMKHVFHILWGKIFILILIQVFCVFLQWYWTISVFLGSSWSWPYGSWIYNYLCNQCLSPLTLWVRNPLSRGVLDTTLC
jgi:uncharacterized integral membrane protein